MIVFRKLLLMLLLIVVFTLPFYSHAYLTRLAFFFALIALLFLSIIKNRLLSVSWQEYFLLFLLILAAIHSALSNYYIGNSVIYAFIYYGSPFFILFSIRRIWVSKKEWLWIGVSYLMGCVTSSILVIKNWVVMGVGSNIRFSIEELNANYVSYSIATGVAVSFILLSLYKETKFKLVINSIILLLIFAVLLSGTRGAVISVAASFFVYYFFNSRSNKLKTYFALCSILIVFVYLISLIPEETLNRISSGSGGGDVSSGRFYLWSLGVSLFYESPLVGSGIGFFEANSLVGARVHNIFLSLAIEFGLLGIAIYSIVFFSNIFMRHDSTELKQVRILFIISWLPIAMTGVWEFAIAPWLIFSWLNRMPKKEYT